MGEFIGEVKPLYGKWHWPFKVMKEGDWFIVDQALRDGEEVRHFASVRAAQLGIMLSVAKSDPEYPGFTRVTRRGAETRSKAEVGQLVDFHVARTKLMDWYSFSIDQLPAGQLFHDGRARIDAPQLKAPSVERLLFDLPGTGRVGLLFDALGFEVQVMRNDETIESWKRQEPSLEELMS